MTATIVLVLIAIVFFVVILAFVFGPTYKANIAQAVPAFIAFFFLLLGLRVIFAPSGPEGNILLGDIFASLALTYFWVLRKK
jgi:hypothetical protein